MAVDAPARIAILGAGPIGLEAALYARFLGYDVDLYERDKAASSLRSWRHVTLFMPWGMNTTSLGIAALRAQNPNWRPLEPAALVTGGELVEKYLQPLAESDLLVDCLQEHTEVLAIRREALGGSGRVEDEEDGVTPFQLLLRNAAGHERTATADVVIDATGCHSGLSPAGAPASDERAASKSIECGLPDPTLWKELRVRVDAETGGPWNVAETLRASVSVAGNVSGSWSEAGIGPAALITEEPDFYVLGAKSFGRRSDFLVAIGHAQIRDVFTILGDRADLDLYAVMKAGLC